MRTAAISARAVRTQSEGRRLRKILPNSDRPTPPVRRDRVGHAEQWRCPIIDEPTYDGQDEGVHHFFNPRKPPSQTEIESTPFRSSCGSITSAIPRRRRGLAIPFHRMDPPAHGPDRNSLPASLNSLTNRSDTLL